MGVTLCYMGTRQRLDITGIGVRAARRRAELGLEQEGVAERACMSRAYISRIENGLVKNPKVEDLAAVAGALDYSLDRLIYGQVSADLVADLPKLLMRVVDPELGGLVAEAVQRYPDMTPGQRTFFLEALRRV